MAVDKFGGFETGDFSEVSSTTGSASVVTSPIKTGVYALRLETNATRQTIKIDVPAASATKTLSFWFRVEVDTPPGAQTQTAVAELTNTPGDNGGIILCRVNTDGTAELASGRHAGSSTETIVSSHTSIAVDTWHLVELLVVSNASTGRIAWKLNGTTQDDTSSLNTGGGNLIALEFRANTTVFGRYLFDNWIVRDNDTYSGDTRVILRKAKSGTPTYDAFTKTSSQAISAVWDDLPFSATDEAHSTAADQAQTALVEDVAAGTDPIGSNDTINGCKVSLIAKKI